MLLVGPVGGEGCQQGGTIAKDPDHGLVGWGTGSILRGFQASPGVDGTGVEPK